MGPDAGGIEVGTEDRCGRLMIRGHRAVLRLGHKPVIGFGESLHIACSSSGAFYQPCEAER